MDTKEIRYLLQGYDNPLIVIANGELPTNSIILDYIEKSQLVVACDGALNKLAEKNYVVDYAIGDGDSVNTAANQNIKHPYIHDPDQNTNDLTKAINFLKSKYQGDLPIIIIGASGGREDHTIANIALLLKYATFFPNIIMLSDYGFFSVLPLGKSTALTIPGQQISFFSLTSGGIVSSKELKWPLVNFEFDYLYSGTLNQATATSLTITTNQSVLLYRSFEIKK